MVEDAHEVSDVNHVAWCRLSPAKAAETLRKLEGGEGEQEEEEDEANVEVDGGTGRAKEEDSRWRGSENLFASAGDDGLVKIWKLE